jgi:hypothetical protein
MANLNLFTHPGTFRRINLKFIHDWLAPHRDYLGQRGFALPEATAHGPLDYERLAAVFMEPDTAMPRQLMHSVALIHEMANDDAMNALLDGARQRNIPLEVGDDPDPADVAVQMWLKDPDLLEELHQLHQLDRPRGFVHFVTDRDPIPEFREPTDVQTADLEAVLAEWYFKHKRSRSARVWMYRRPHEYWFLLRHGLASRRQEVLSPDGSDTLIFRPGEYDVLVYNCERGELRIHGCNVKEVENLRRAFGKHLFTDEEFFPGGAKFTLAPLVEARRACLACGDIPGIQHITLTEIQAFSGGKDWLRVTFQAPDIFTAIERGDFVLPAVDRLVRASFVVRFSDSAKQRTVKIAGSNKLSVVRDGDTVLVERWLSARGFVASIPQNEEEPGILARA